MIAALAFVLVLMQEPDVETLLDRLAGDSVTAHDEAAKELVRRGDTAIAAIRRRLPKLTGDEWRRFDGVLLKAEAEARRRAFRAEPIKITLEVEKKPFAEALAELAGKIGFRLDAKLHLEKSVTVKAEGVTPLEALDALCRAAEATWWQQWSYPPGLDAKSSLTLSARPARHPNLGRLYVGNYRVELTGLQLERHRSPGRDTESAWIGGAIQPSPRLGQVASDSIDVGRVVDDQGRELYRARPARQRPKELRLFGSASLLGHLPWTVGLKYPEADARSISLLGGKAELRCEVERLYTGFEASQDSVGRTLEFEGLKIKARSFHREGRTVKIGVSQEGRRAAKLASAKVRAVTEHKLDFPELRLRDGTSVPFKGAPGYLHEEGGSSIVEYTFETAGEPAEFRFVTYTVHELDTVEFEFKDVPLPK